MGQDGSHDRGSKESIVRRYELQAKKLRAREKAGEYDRGEEPGRPPTTKSRKRKRSRDAASRDSGVSDPARERKDGAGTKADKLDIGERWEEKYKDEPAFQRIRRSTKSRRRTTPVRTSSSGRVVAVDRGLISVMVDDVGLIRARPLQLAAPDPDQTPVVGDLVDLSERREVHRVEKVHPRTTVLCRSDPSGRTAPRVLAANVDIGVVVVPANDPHPGLVERLRIALDRGGVSAQVVINKIDLIQSSDRDEILRSFAFLEADGAPAIMTSVVSGEGIDNLRDRLRSATCVFVGHSGVGKSTLLNWLDPDHQRATQDVRDGDGKGRHTTTRSELSSLDDGTMVIDTPGVRAFGLHEVSEEDVREHFAELLRLGCRFRDCRHLGDDGCAADDAVASGALDRDRLIRFRRVIRSLEEET